MGILIEPLDVCHFGTGTGSTAGSVHVIKSHSFPFHFTIAGAIRSEVMRRSGKDPSELAEYLNKGGKNEDFERLLKNGRYFGPFLLKDNKESGIEDRLYLPLPANIYRISEKEKREEKNQKEYFYAGWMKTPSIMKMDVPEGLTHFIWIDSLYRYEFSTGFLNLKGFVEYLKNPDFLDGEVREILHISPVKMVKPRIKIKKETGVAEDTYLYFEEYVYFFSRTDDGEEPYYLFIETEFEHKILPENEDGEGLLPLGGENRFVVYSRVGFSLREYLEPVKDEVINRIIENSSDGEIFFNLILLTPAYFKDGWKPVIDGVEIKGAVMERPIKYSGWDMATTSPAPTKNYVREGTVFLCRTNERAIVEGLYLGSIGDEGTERGLGIVIPGVPKIIKKEA